ncbi:hypothetical protein [Clostridium cellulovorans]|uniref:Uncharacterized protein n=1 Tax=Clostridium cellulovorans (strain ATCC 35296 / DSM 3052 / OCM 3 / 743B) TaxID=573061 RepID=D9SRR2_CLOC7|nr:hypothetical protein [Clostridium cellulovorans]ADL50429.1 hypothetical protein Clocel_0658 [Clostridium cellulovorans 743B]
MKFKKKRLIALSLIIGSTLFVSTALAEINSKSGYEQGKDILKYTASQLYEGSIKSYTIETETTLLDNDDIMEKQNEVKKYDIVNKRMEDTSTQLKNGQQVKYYFYKDLNKDISYDKSSDTYYVTQFSEPQSIDYLGKNPFKQQYASDFEKIADAVVGNLKDYVVVSERPDGSKMLSGAISKTQIPALVNAISSYLMKQELSNTYDQEKQAYVDRGLKDVFVKAVKGSANVSKSGIVESVNIDTLISARDDKEEFHIFTLKTVIKVKDLNSTVVNEPNLKEKTVQTTYIDNKGSVTASDKVDIGIYKGTYKNDILIVKDNNIVKIGERVLEIREISESKINAYYSENYLEGYENYKKSAIFADIEKNLEKHPDKNPAERYYSIAIEFTYGDNDEMGYLGLYEPTSVNVSFEKHKQDSDVIANSNLVRVLN